MIINEDHILKTIAEELQRIADQYEIKVLWPPTPTPNDPWARGKNRRNLACYIVDYINHEQERHGKTFVVDDTMILDAIAAYKSINELTMVVI